MTITSILVANRGEIARRVFRSAREMGVRTVAVFSDGDADAPFVAEADVAVPLGGITAAQSYLDGTKIIAAAQAAGADAIHPGYGFLSENAAFATAVIDAGLTWIGPPPAAIAAMGDKLAAKATMSDADVPTLPSVEITGDVDLAAAGTEIGYPVLVKASAGGGGKGMRIVTNPADLADAVDSARREAASSFGNDTVFLERYLPAPRHVEIQVLGDLHGTVVHLGERECSIQRRHQKVIEEAPSPAVDTALRERMGAAAVAAVTAIGYASAGTVEFLLDGDDFYFLEVNTRLQVEHPVTEEITGIDLVREMIRVADGEPLGYDQDAIGLAGHAVEARLYAEDPANDFLPATGTLSVWDPCPDPAVRVDSGVEAGSVVGVEFDPMLAKIVARGPTRREAALRLALALERTRLHGVVTNRDFLVACLRSEEFLSGDTTTDFIDRVDPPRRRTLDEGSLRRIVAAVALVSQSENRASAGALGFMAPGYRNTAMPPEELPLTVDGADVLCEYRRRRDGIVEMSVDGGEPCEVVAARVDPAGVDLTIDGLRTSMSTTRVDGGWYVHGTLGHAAVTVRSKFPDTDAGTVEGAQVAPMPGRILSVDVSPGDRVEPGQLLVLMEAMKMEHRITAPAAGEVTEVRVAVGDQVDNGAVLVVVGG